MLRHPDGAEKGQQISTGASAWRVSAAPGVDSTAQNSCRLQPWVGITILELERGRRPEKVANVNKMSHTPKSTHIVETIT